MNAHGPHEDGHDREAAVRADGGEREAPAAGPRPAAPQGGRIAGPRGAAGDRAPAARPAGRLGRGAPDLRRLVLAAMFAAIATLLGPLSIPVGPARVFPFQHTVNAIAGILLGPWYAAGAALVTAILRYSFHWGSLFAFPGSPFGAFVVGYAYRLLRNDAAALCEPIGTGPIGATLAAWMFQPLVGSHHTWIWFQIAFLTPSIPGAVLGYVIVRVLRRVPAVNAWVASP